MFRPSSLENKIRLIKISATALTQETECKIQLRRPRKPLATVMGLGNLTGKLHADMGKPLHFP